LSAWDPVWLVALNAAVVTWMWLRHGGPQRLTDGAEWLVAIGQLTGLYAALAVLVGLVLVSRAPWVERRYGMDQALRAHRWVGLTAAWLMLAHILVSTVGLAAAAGISLWDQLVDYVRNYPYLANAFIGIGLLAAVVVVSLRAVRARVSYETWWFVHLGAYAGVALVFGHQTAIGADFALDPWAYWYWVLLYASVAYLLLVHRWAALVWRLMRHRTRIEEVISQGDGVVTLVVSGRRLDTMAVQAGQFFLVRVLAAGRWWKAHPFSLSAAPDGTSLRFTVKALGDDTASLQTIEPGTRVGLEGPYGGFLGVLPTDRKMLFIAGGIGITPFRGLIDDIHRPEDAALIYRNPTPDEAVFREDLERLSQERGFELHLSYSRTDDPDPSPLDAPRLLRLVPDVAAREVFVIGSPPLVAAARRALRDSGVPSSRIHLESFSY
jgi:predicted ferric reductase